MTLNQFTIKMLNIWTPNIITVSVIRMVKLIVQYSNVPKRSRWNGSGDPDQHVYIGAGSDLSVPIL